LDKWLRSKVEAKERGLSRWLAVKVLTLLFTDLQVSANNKEEAQQVVALIAPRGYLHAALVRRSSGGWVIDRLNVAVVALSVFLPAALLASLTTFLPPLVWVAVGVAWLIALLIWLSKTPRPGFPQRRDGAIDVLFLACLCAVLGLSLAWLPAPPGDRGGPLLLGILFTVLASGFLVEWRSRGLGKSLYWTMPLAYSALVALGILLGTISYYVYFDVLGLPSEYVKLGPFERGVGGMVSLSWGAAIIVVAFALYGLVRWVTGPAAVSNVMLTLAKIVSVVSILSQTLNTGISHAVALQGAQPNPGATLPSFYLLEPT
jgi:hypothetical protein